MEDTSDAVLLRDCHTIHRISLGTSEEEVADILTALPQRVTVAKNYTLQLLRRPSKSYDPKRFFVFKPLEHDQRDGQIHCLLGKLLQKGADTDFIVTKRPQDEDIAKKSSGAEDAHSSEYFVMLDCLYLPGAWRWRPPELRRLGRDTLLERSLSFATLRPGRSTDELGLSGMSNRGFHIGWANPPNVWTAGDAEADIPEADYDKALTEIELAPLYGRHWTTMTKLKHLMDAAGIQQRAALQVLSRFERESDGARLWAKLRSITVTSKYADFQALNRILSHQRGPPVPLTLHAPERQQQQQVSTASFELHPYVGNWSSIASDACRIDTVLAHTHTLIGEGESRYPYSTIFNVVMDDRQQNLMPFAAIRDKSTGRCSSFLLAKDVQQDTFWLLINLPHANFHDRDEDETGEKEQPWVCEAKLSCWDTAFTLAQVEVLSWPDQDGKMVCKIVADSVTAGEICIRT